jgi:hypothetical protein
MIQQLLTFLGLAQQPAQVDDTLDRFMAGASIPKLSSGSADIIARQREIEDGLRSYLASQDRYIGQLESQVAELIRQSTREDQ